MDVAKDLIRTRKFTMLVEGQIDVLLAHQAGFQNVVALSGTALSEKHLMLMKRYSENLMLVLDADAAGLGATARSAALAPTRATRKGGTATLGERPSRYHQRRCKRLFKAYRRRQANRRIFLIELAEKERDPHRLLRSAEGIVLPLIKAMPSPMEREHFIQTTARALSLSGEAVRESLKRLPKHPEITDNAVRVTENSFAACSLAARYSRRTTLAVLHTYPNTPLCRARGIRVSSNYWKPSSCLRRCPRSRRCSMQNRRSAKILRRRLLTSFFTPLKKRLSARRINQR